MSVVLWNVVVGGLQMTLREAAGPNYTLVFRALHDPVQISITHLGCDRRYALHIFARKVECHRAMVGESTEISV
jgi:hypothetical protein